MPSDATHNLKMSDLNTPSENSRPHPFCASNPPPGSQAPSLHRVSCTNHHYSLRSNRRTVSRPNVWRQGEGSFPKDIPLPRIAKGSLEELLQENPDPYQHARDGSKVIVGPMPVKAFLEEFLPPAPAKPARPKVVGAFRAVPLNPTKERDIYTPLVEDINDRKLCPSVTFCIAADGRRRKVPVPAICGYTRDDIRTFQNGGKVIQKGSYTMHGGNLGLAEIVIDVKKDHDPFYDHHVHGQSEGNSRQSLFSFLNHDYVKESEFDAGKEEKRNLAESVHYAADACLRQHRIFYFSILIIRTRVRFFRWDRAGGVVSRAIDYREHPEILCEFLWRYHHASPVQRGFDPTATTASKTEEALFVETVKRHIASQLNIDEKDAKKMNDALEQHYERGKVAKMEVYDNGIRCAPRVFLVSVPLASSKSAIGRSTRAYWAVELIAPGKGRVRFLKDVWRVDDDDMMQEGIIYKELERGRVEFVCDLECSGDVPSMASVARHDLCSSRKAGPCSTAFRAIKSGQCTRTNEYIDAPWVCQCLRSSLSHHVSRRVHYRIVLKQAGYPLRTFKGSRELFGAAHDALRAIESAHVRCKRLHRDVSLDNIILYRPEPSQPRLGMLVDWEFSVSVDAHGKAIDDTQIGTWPFMSIKALDPDENFRHTKEDDMESLLYVVMYACVRWLPHVNEFRLGKWIYKFFDETCVGFQGQIAGGTRKVLEQSSSGSAFLEKFGFENPYIRMWFKATYHYFKTDYEPTRAEGEASLWTIDNFRYAFRTVCHGLSMSEETNWDRAEHEVNDYLAAVDEACRSTDASLRGAARFFRANLSAFDAPPLQSEDVGHGDGDESHHLELRSSKRRLDECSEVQDTVTVVDQKRARTDRKNSSVRSTHSDSAMFGGPRRTYNLRSRRLEPQSCLLVHQEKRRSSRLAAKTKPCGFRQAKASITRGRYR